MKIIFDAILGKLRQENPVEPAAADVKIADAGGHYTGTTVEAALQEIGTALDGVETALEEI